MRKNILYATAIAIVVGIALLVPAHAASAMVRISQSAGNNILYGDQTWERSQSPYILDSDTYVYGNLTVEPGVEIYGTGNLIIANGASFVAKGTNENRISIRDLNSMQITYGSKAVFENVDISRIASHVYVFKSKANIGASTIRRSGTALRITDSEVRVWGSRIEGNLYGVRVVGNYINPNPSASSTRVSIRNSSLLSQLNYSIKNDSNEYIDMSGNWWGRPDGPVGTYSQTSSTTGYIVPSKLNVYSPWLTEEPSIGLEPVAASPTCCSNILFIPGLKASRLYRDEVVSYGSGTSTDRLWEPMNNGDVRSLFLNENGQSIDREVYSGSPIDSVFGIDIYGSFMEFLDSLKKEGSINEWRSFGYDWRKSVDDVVNGMEAKSAGGVVAGSASVAGMSTKVESLVGTLESLASTSDTGKVTVIAHSNGGLVMKYVAKKLEDMGRSDLVDKVISVAVPYLGTPKAILGILHGYDESIAYGLILKSSVARMLGINMPSAYGLIPSAAYIERILSPVVAFASTTIAGANDGRYGTEISNKETLDGFMADSGNIRKDVDMGDTSEIAKANSALMEVAKYLHGIIDPFDWPARIASYAIVGWGRDTPSGISYSEGERCYGFIWNRVCEKVPVYEPMETKYGDGTVVSRSADVGSLVVLTEELGADSSAGDLRKVDHATILSASTTKALIRDIVTNEKESLADKWGRLPGVSIGDAAYAESSGEKEEIVFSTHSPVDLHVYDSAGRHTGRIPAPSGTDEIFVAYEEGIPGSSFRITGNEGSPETYISVPYNSGEYGVRIYGTGTGEFTYRVERKMGSEIVERVDYAGLPVTPLMSASTILTSYGVALASSSAALLLDMDGDYVADAEVKAGSEPDPTLFLSMIKKTLERLGVRDGRVKELIKKLDHIAEMVKKGKANMASNVSQSVIKSIGNKKLKGMTAADREMVLDSIYEYFGQDE